MHHDDDRPGGKPARVSRRDFIRISSATTLASGLPLAAANAQPPASGEMPVATVGLVSALKVDSPVGFSYPDANSPAVLMRLAQPAMGGVGPGQSIVAFSTLCTHKGCPVGYRMDRKLLVCPCHWSSFDPAKGGQMVIGQGSQSLPQITLRVQGDQIQAVGLEGLVFGRHTNVL